MTPPAAPARETDDSARPGGGAWRPQREDSSEPPRGAESAYDTGRPPRAETGSPPRFEPPEAAWRRTPPEPPAADNPRTPARGSPPVPPGEQPSRPPVTGVAPDAGSTEVEGQVRGIQVRSEYRGESQSEAIWTFRVERYDNAGNRVLLVPVEMRGLTFEGSVGDGDWVRMRGRMKAGTLRVTRLENLTTGASVQAKRLPKAVLIAAIVVAVAIAAWIAWIVYQVVTADSGPPPDFPDNGG